MRPIVSDPTDSGDVGVGEVAPKPRPRTCTEKTPEKMQEKADLSLLSRKVTEKHEGEDAIAGREGEDAVTIVGREDAVAIAIAGREDSRSRRERRRREREASVGLGKNAIP